MYVDVNVPPRRCGEESRSRSHLSASAKTVVRRGRKRAAARRESVIQVWGYGSVLAVQLRLRDVGPWALCFMPCIAQRPSPSLRLPARSCLDTRGTHSIDPG